MHVTMYHGSDLDVTREGAVCSGGNAGGWKKCGLLLQSQGDFTRIRVKGEGKCRRIGVKASYSLILTYLCTRVNGKEPMLIGFPLSFTLTPYPNEPG